MDNIFGENLHFLRTQKGLTLSKLAENIGFSSSQWNNYELGSSYPKFLDLVKISKYFGIPESDLMHKNLKSGLDKHYQERNTLENQFNEPVEQYINYKELAESRKETIDSLKREISYLEEKIVSLTDKRKAG